MQIIYGHTERSLSPEQYYADFDHETNRIFQVADLMTYITRLVYKRRNSIPLNKSDRLFFTGDNLNLLDRDTVLKTTP